MAFASFLARSLVGEQAQLTALLAFNLGVELGQVLVAAALTVAVLALRRGSATTDGFLAPSWLRRAGSACVAIAGFYWFFERV